MQVRPLNGTFRLGIGPGGSNLTHRFNLGMQRGIWARFNQNLTIKFLSDEVSQLAVSQRRPEIDSSFNRSLTKGGEQQRLAFGLPVRAHTLPDEVCK